VHAAQGVLRDVPSAHGYRGGFNAGFMSKDLRLALQLAGTARQPLPMGERAAQLYQQVRGGGGGSCCCCCCCQQPTVGIAADAARVGVPFRLC
jgi:3-hydroxyisobutyrate dehydrogenase